LSSKAKKAATKKAEPKEPAKVVKAEQPQESAKPTAAAKPAGPNDVIYIDATGHIAGRLCSEVASQILRGQRIVVLNAEKAVLSGKRDTVIAAWKQKLELGSKVNPIYGPLHPRKPDNIVWRMVRGMVPKTKPKGTLGLKRLRVYIGVPEKYAGVTMTKLDDAMATRPLPMYTTILDLARNIGWNG
jgi:large subunit ribosomal protein L13